MISGLVTGECKESYVYYVIFSYQNGLDVLRRFGEIVLEPLYRKRPDMICVLCVFCLCLCICVGSSFLFMLYANWLGIRRVFLTASY